VTATARRQTQLALAMARDRAQAQAQAQARPRMTDPCSPRPARQRQGPTYCFAPLLPLAAPCSPKAKTAFHFLGENHALGPEPDDRRTNYMYNNSKSNSSKQIFFFSKMKTHSLHPKNSSGMLWSARFPACRPFLGLLRHAPPILFLFKIIFSKSCNKFVS
jgi:hypothetical protein